MLLYPLHLLCPQNISRFYTHETLQLVCPQNISRFYTHKPYICYAPRISLGFIHTKPYSCYAPRISLDFIHTKPYSCYAPRISLGCIHTKLYSCGRSHYISGIYNTISILSSTPDFQWDSCYSIFSLFYVYGLQIVVCLFVLVRFLVGFVLLDLQFYVYGLQIVVCPFFLFRLAIVCYGLLRNTDSDYPFDIFILFFFLCLVIFL